MQFLLKTFLGLLFVSTTLYAETSIETPTTTTDALTASAAVAKQWLALVDEGRYGDSWSTASLRMQLVMPKSEWEKFLNTSRKPLGQVTSRTLVEQRPSKNPKGLAAGDYMVILYKTVFSNRPKGEELLTLSLGADGNWRILTYLVK
jgi:hypothetical protein